MMRTSILALSLLSVVTATAATTTTSTTLTTSGWTDLGVGPLKLGGTAAIVYQVGDSAPSNTLTNGFSFPVESSADLNVSSHVWARLAPSTLQGAALTTPIVAPSGGGGGGGAITAASGAMVDGASVTQGTKTDAPCALPASSTACSQIALAKAVANAANGPLALRVKRLSGLTNTAIQVGTSTTGGDSLVGLQCGNTNSALAFVQVIDKATQPTSIGTTDTPTLGSYPITANGNTGGFALGIAAVASTTGIWAAATTLAANGVAPTTALDCNAFYYGP